VDALGDSISQPMGTKSKPYRGTAVAGVGSHRFLSSAPAKQPPSLRARWCSWATTNKAVQACFVGLAKHSLLPIAGE